MKFIFFF